MKFPKNDFTPAPKGLHLAVACDFVDLGMKDKNFNGHAEKVHCVQYRFQSSKINPENKKPWLIMTSQMRLSSNERSNLRKMLESWRGEAFTDKEMETFELESMIGVMAQILIVHNETPKGTFANIEAIMPVPEGTRQLVVMDYVRVCDREKSADDMVAAAEAEEATAGVGDPDNIPF